MKYVKPKKSFGQHFLIDKVIANDIVHSLLTERPGNVLEVGPGMGVLTELLLRNPLNLKVVEIDNEAVRYLIENKIINGEQVIQKDFLKLNLDEIFPEPYSIIGNFPYNISSQIFFKVLEFKDSIPLVVGMLQKEVAERLSASHGNKSYGILSVLLQVFYDVEYLFTVQEHVFDPPPKVKSGVIRVKRNSRQSLDCDLKTFTEVVKSSFSTRRKTLRNALKSMNLPTTLTTEIIFDKRAEQLSVEDFINLTKKIISARN